ncbi:MAG: glycosyltransferase family 4 protein [Muribaculum sp.]|nr:glycosyltransferase family 4 protein [Muribaculaceae bacterium]MCM1081223.1 glycosyltransferase family 4 protein [Muribaculum sp.]
MKVLFIDVYNYRKGGAESVCFNTARLLEEHGHNTIRFTLKWDKNEPSPYEKYFAESKETRRGPARQLKNLVNYFYHTEAAHKLDRLLADEHPDIAHIHLIWGQITGSILPVLRKHGVPVVYTVHDYRLVCPAYTFRNGRGHVCEQCGNGTFWHCFTNNCCKGNRLFSAVMAAEQYFRNAFFNPSSYIDGFIYVSHFACDIQQRYMPATKAAESICLYNFSMTMASQPKRRGEDPYFLFFGRLSYEKGVRTLLEAFRSMPDCQLKLVGTGPEEEALRQFAAENGMNNVRFLGYKSGEDLTDIVEQADFVVVPSEWYENNPMTIVEAYSVGTPVIGASIGGIPEIIIDNTTGYIFESGNAASLSQAIAKARSLDADAYSRMSDSALQFASTNFNPANYCTRILNFYTDIIHRYK